MRLLLNQKTVSDQPALLFDLLSLIELDAQFLRASYPLFNNWLAKKVVPGICAGERTVLIECRESAPVGLLIVKHTPEEKKLCTLRVRPHFESKGLGIKLFETAFELLETDRPLVSVSEIALSKFSKIFEHFGFSHEASYEGVYLPKVVEFSFNGVLSNARCVQRETSLSSIFRCEDQFSRLRPHRIRGAPDFAMKSPVRLLNGRTFCD